MVKQATPSARVALNLTGVEHHAIMRGDALVRGAQWVRSTVVDVALAPEAGATPTRNAQLLAYVGSGEHHVSVRVLDDSSRFARVRFAVPMALARGSPRPA